MARFKTKQDAVDAYERESHQTTAYHFALRAFVRGEAKRVGTVRDGKDSYTWHIAFSPRYYAAVIVQVFKSHVNRDESISVFWLSDWQRSTVDGYLWDHLVSTARRMEQEVLEKENPNPTVSDSPNVVNAGGAFDSSTALALTNGD